MFGRKTLEEKLRAAGAPRATGTILACERGYPTYSGSAGDKETTKYTYRVRVEPEGGAAFEAETFIRGFWITPAPAVGDTVPILFDPARPADVAIDTADLRDVKAARVIRETLAIRVPSPGKNRDRMLTRIVELRDRGKLTPAEFDELDAKLRSAS